MDSKIGGFVGGVLSQEPDGESLVQIMDQQCRMAHELLQKGGWPKAKGQFETRVAPLMLYLTMHGDEHLSADERSDLMDIKFGSYLDIANILARFGDL